MVSPETHIVKNHESQLNKPSRKLKIIGLLYNQTVNQKRDSKPLHYHILKLKYSLSILKHNKG